MPETTLTISSATCDDPKTTTIVELCTAIRRPRPTIPLGTGTGGSTGGNDLPNPELIAQALEYLHAELSEKINKVERQNLELHEQLQGMKDSFKRELEAARKHDVHELAGKQHEINKR